MNITLSFSKPFLNTIQEFITKHIVFFLTLILSAVSVISYMIYLNNGLGLSYNDARSHLDIGRRVVEGLKPGLAQIGSVWLPLPHLLMVPTIWNDFMWHSGLAGAIQSMISFVGTGIIIYKFLEKLGASMLARLVGVFVFVANINILYLQSTAMTELILIFTMTAGVYMLYLWQESQKLLYLVISAFFVMLATLVRYDGWFLFMYSSALIFLLTWIKQKSFKVAEGTTILFVTLAGIGIGLWFLWNLLIFKDPFYFAFGEFSAHAQQQQLDQAGVLDTKKNMGLSIIMYLYGLAYNSYAFILALGAIGAGLLLYDKKLKPELKAVSTALLAPLAFNILALYLGFSVLYIQGISGNTWFNVRYGVMMAPSIAIFVGYLIHKAGILKYTLIGFILLVASIAFINQDAVTIDDARVGSSQKNVSEVSGWLSSNTSEKEGFILISAASHDAIIFSSGLPMKKYIHEGTGAYWESATTTPDRWARWIVMRTNDVNDMTFKAVNKTQALSKYNLVAQYPFADIYELKPEYISQLQTKPVLGKQR